MSKERLDKLLVDRGLAPSRERAKALIMEGRVLVRDRPVTKAGTQVQTEEEIRLRGQDIPFVSRGGMKLEAALKTFGIGLKRKIVMDVGASTGGFTDCMLKNGAARVHAVDVGYGQFDHGLRQDSRVILYERTNIRYLEKEQVLESIDFVAVDVSFISLKTVMSAVWKFLSADAEAVILVKPQFEVGKGNVGKGGIVKEKGKRVEALHSVCQYMEDLGFDILEKIESPMKGQKGNVEYLVHLKRKPHV